MVIRSVYIAQESLKAQKIEQTVDDHLFARLLKDEIKRAAHIVADKEIKSNDSI